MPPALNKVFDITKTGRRTPDDEKPMFNLNRIDMKLKLHLLPLMAAAIIIASCTGKAPKVLPPVAEKIPHELESHGHLRVDNYYWMRLSDEQKSSETPDAETQRVLDYQIGRAHV